MVRESRNVLCFLTFPVHYFACVHTYSFSGLSELERYSTVKVEKIIINKNEEYDNT